MVCKNHEEKEMKFVCNVCGEPLCEDCSVELENAVYCKECLGKLLKHRGENAGGKKAKKSWILALCLSLIPGTGHMYLGLIKKGLTIMSLLFSLVFVVILFSESSAMYWTAGYLIPTLSFLFLTYSIFDCLSLTGRINSGENLSDEGIYELELLRDMIIRKRFLCSLLLISAGLIGVINIFSRTITDIIRVYLGINFSIAGMVFAIFLVVLGIYLLREGHER
jgi:hypothetical protein